MYTVLICDDDKDIVSALEIYLTSEGYKTVSAYNGEQAIQAVNEGNIDLILMDIMMPQLDGIRATARLPSSWGIMMSIKIRSMFPSFTAWMACSPL